MKRLPVDIRFWSTVEFTDTCWLWYGTKDQRGYGIFTIKGVKVKAHRWSYEYHRGKIPDGLVIDHLCRVHNCVNPDHMEPVTQRVNVERGLVPGPKPWMRKPHLKARGPRPHTLKEFCKRGHSYAEHAVYKKPGKRTNGLPSRYCRLCHRARNKKVGPRKKYTFKQPRPSVPMSRVNLDLRDELVEWMKKRARSRYMSMTGYIRDLILADRLKTQKEQPSAIESDKLDVAEVAE